MGNIGGFFFFTFLKNLFETERVHAHMGGGGGRGRRRENPKQAPRSAQSLTRGSIPCPWDHDPSRNQESEQRSTGAPTHRCSINKSLMLTFENVFMMSIISFLFHSGTND